MDPWCRRFLLPMGHHHWSPSRLHRQQLYPKPHRSFVLPHSHRHPVCLGSCSFRWHVRVARGNSLVSSLFISPLTNLSIQSPRFLIKRGRDAAAAKALARLTGATFNDPAVELELDGIRNNLKQEEEIGQSSYLDCFRDGGNKIRLRTLTGIFLQAWQQLTGINFIFYYGTSFFKNSHVGDPFLQSVATNVVNVGMTLPGIYFVDKAGRRRLLLIGALGMLTCEYIVAIAGVTISTDNIAGQKVLVAFVCIYIVSPRLFAICLRAERPLGLLRCNLGPHCVGGHWRNLPS